MSDHTDRVCDSPDALSALCREQAAHARLPAALATAGSLALLLLGVVYCAKGPSSEVAATAGALLGLAYMVGRHIAAGERRRHTAAARLLDEALGRAALPVLLQYLCTASGVARDRAVPAVTSLLRQVGAETTLGAMSLGALARLTTADWTLAEPDLRDAARAMLVRLIGDG